MTDMNDIASTWRTTSRISLAGGSGWGPTERVEAVHGGGRALVRVETCPVAPGSDLDTLADLHAQGVAVPGGHDSGLSPAPGPVLGSADGRVRVTSWTDEAGRHIEATTSYALLHGRLATVTTVVADGDPELAAQAAGIAATAEVAAPTSMEDESLPLRPGEVDLSEAAALWRAGTTPAPAIDHVLTTEETFAAARHYGVAMLPGADTAQWDQLDGGQRHLASAVAWRSLEVRGAAEGGDLGEALELAASHDLIVMVAERNADDTRATWFAARPDRMVRLRPDGAGRMVLTTHPTGDLADLLLLGHGDPEVTVNASAVFRSEGRVVGDEAGWRGSADPASVRVALSGLVTAAGARSTS